MAPEADGQAAQEHGGRAGAGGTVAEAVTKVESGSDAPIAAERDEKAFLDHLKRVNDIFYDQIRIADQKATFTFTFMGAFLVTSAEGRAVFRIERYLTADPVTAVLSAALATGVVLTLLFGILVVLPRHRATGTSLYWGGWPGNRSGFLAAREKADLEWIFREYLGNVDNLSAINRAKYRYVGFAFRTLLLTVVSYCLLLGWGTAASAP